MNVVRGLHKNLFLIILFTVCAILSFLALSIKNNSVKVSVIIPVYNVENYLKECIDSVINQTLTDIEIICIDDGSTDGSTEILNEYASKGDNRIKVFYQQNSGVSATRNKGIDIAIGEYIKFVDSDDILHKDACKICYSKAKELDADIVFHESTEDIVFEKPLFNLFTPSSCFTLYRTKFIKDNNIRFNESTSYGEDQAFNLICSPKANKIVSISDHLYTYRNNPTSACHTSNIQRHSDSHAKNVKYVYDDWNKNGYFFDDTAKINFLRWFCDMNYWKNDYDIDKMFLNSIGGELLEEETLSLLPQEYRKSIKEIIEIVKLK